jgi:hypothetical protein
MSLFLSDHERALIAEQHNRTPLNQFYWALLGRAERRAAKPGLSDRSATSDWWHFVQEYLTDGAMAYALKPTATLAAWVRDVTLSLIRRPVAEWVGPPFRGYSGGVPVGNLETSHLTIAVAVALDLAGEVFSVDERAEIANALREKGLALLRRWLDQNTNFANWRCVINAGVAVAAAVIDDSEHLSIAAQEFRLLCDVFQPDGSYGEGVQYGNYAAHNLMLAREALTRYNSSAYAALPLEPYAAKPRWDVYSLLYQKPLSGWGAYPLPRFANFNDSAAIYRPSADVLLHSAARAQASHPREAGLARWLFDTLYTPYIDREPRDRATFGFVPDFGFLTLPLLPQAAPALSPEAAELPTVADFSCGDSFARDAWDGRTVLAVHGGGDPLHGPGHLHGDLNSFILAHNQERLLADPGHSCYRNLIHELESATLTHNTCTFQIGDEARPLLQENQLRDARLQQQTALRRALDPRTGVAAPPVARGGKRLLLAQAGSIAVIGSEAAQLYGAPLAEFARFWLLCGSHVLFVVDRIVSTQPVKTTWHWLLNNRDGLLDLRLFRPDRLVARRGNAGMKLFHLADGTMAGPIYAYMHDAYHPLPNQQGEGKPGSGMLMSFTEREPALARTALHVFVLDDAGSIGAWHLHTTGSSVEVEGPAASSRWTIEMQAEPLHVVVAQHVTGEAYELAAPGGVWQFTPRM